MSNPVSIEEPSDQRCQHINSRGHRCRMLISAGHDSLCPHHLNRLKAERAKNDEAVVDALLGPIDDFFSADSVNLFLGNLLKQLVHKRIDRRDALAQAYICQLLLNTFPHMRREVEDATDKQGCEELLRGFLEDRRAAQAKEESGSASSVSIPLYPAAQNRSREEPVTVGDHKQEAPG